MTGTTNQIQTPFGTGVRASLGLSAGSAGGISQMPANPSVTTSGTLYGTLFTLWQGANEPNGSYTAPVIMATFDDANANGTTVGLPTITAIDCGSIQVINNSINGTYAAMTSFAGSNLLQVSSDFSPSMAALTTITMPKLAYIGGGISPSFPALTSWDFSGLIGVGGAFAPTSGATTILFTALSYVGSSFGGTFASATTLNLNGLQYVPTSLNVNAASLATLSLPALVSVGTTFQLSMANLVTFSIGATLKSIGGNFTMTGAKLNQASVDGILVSLAALDGTGGTTAYSSLTVNLSGGTSSAPSATGLAAKATLVGRGCTVTTN